MLRRFFYLFLLGCVLSGLLLAQTGCTTNGSGTRTASDGSAARSSASGIDTTSEPGHLSKFAVVDPNYIYNQLFYMATHFLHREAGFDTNLPPKVNGHDEF